MKVLISGAGIAGPTLAYWLSRRGFEPTLVERAPALRMGRLRHRFLGRGLRRGGAHGARARVEAPGLRRQGGAHRRPGRSESQRISSILLRQADPPPLREPSARLDKSPELYFDRVSQIQMPEWSRGRVALAGQGSALAMISAYALAGELARARGDYRWAFSRYQGLLSPFMADEQKAAIGFAGVFAPKSAVRLFLRDQIAKAPALPFVARLVFGRGLLDAISLPEHSEF